MVVPRVVIITNNRKLGGNEKAKRNFFLQNYMKDVGNSGGVLVMCASNRRKRHFHSAYL